MSNRSHSSPTRRRTSRLLATCLAAATALSCTAPVEGVSGPDASRPVVGAGGRVAGLSGSYAYREDDIRERELFSLRATIDEYLTDNHVVGAYVLGQFSNVETDADGREQLWTGVHYHYHHHLSEETSVFLGPQLGWTFFDDEGANDSSFTYGLSGGVRHWLTRRVALTLEPTFLRADFSDDAGDDSSDFLLMWGLAFSL